jgi:hypothetical protein
MVENGKGLKKFLRHHIVPITHMPEPEVMYMISVRYPDSIIGEVKIVSFPDPQDEMYFRMKYKIIAED